MSWSLNFKGKKEEVLELIDSYPVPEHFQSEEKELFSRSKEALKAEVEAESNTEGTTGYVFASFSGHGYNDTTSPVMENNSSSMEFRVRVSREPAPIDEV